MLHLASPHVKVAHAAVNHVPVMTGGIGRDALESFYAKHFIPKCVTGGIKVPLLLPRSLFVRPLQRCSCVRAPLHASSQPAAASDMADCA